MLNVVWYRRAEKLVKDKTTEVADTVLTRSQSVVDERIRRIKSNAVNISLSADVRRYADYADPKSAKSIYTYTTIDKTLQKYISLDSYTEMIFITAGRTPFCQARAVFFPRGNFTALTASFWAARPSVKTTSAQTAPTCLCAAAKARLFIL